MSYSENEKELLATLGFREVVEPAAEPTERAQPAAMTLVHACGTEVIHLPHRVEGNKLVQDFHCSSCKLIITGPSKALIWKPQPTT